MTRRDNIRFLLFFVLLITLIGGGAWLWVDHVFEEARKTSVEKCKSLGTDPADMIYLRNEHYLCVTKDGRVVGRT